MTVPNVQDSIVYVGGGYGWDRRTSIYSIEERTGRVLWQRPFGPPFKGITLELDAKHIYVAGQDTLYALDRATGATLWRYPNVGRFRIARDGVVFVDGFGADIVAVDGASGTQLWRSTLIVPPDTLAIVGDYLYAAAGGKIFALQRSSGETREVALKVRPASWVSGLDSTLLIITRDSDTSWTTVEWNPANGALDTLEGRLAEQSDSLLVFTKGAETIATDRRTRQERWRTSQLSTAQLGGGVFQENRMYQADLMGKPNNVNAFDIPSGRMQWTLKTNDLANHPARGNGRIIVSSDDCRIFAVRK